MNDPHLLLSGYALDALDPDDRALFEDHLTQCEDCRRELAEFGPAVAELSALTATPPPPDLRQDVLSAISRVRQLDPGPPQPSRTAAGEGAADSGSDVQSSEPVGQAGTAQRRTGRRIVRNLFTIAAAVVILAVVALGAWTYGRTQATHSYRADNATVSRILGAPDARTFRQLAPNGMRITYVVSKERNAAMAVVENSTSPGNDRTYQLWTVRTEGGKPDFVPDRTFTEPSGPIILSTDIRAADALGITVEPTGGSPKPTTKPFAVQPV